jgi:hypothetical protein
MIETFLRNGRRASAPRSRDTLKAAGERATPGTSDEGDPNGFTRSSRFRIAQSINQLGYGVVDCNAEQHKRRGVTVLSHHKQETSSYMILRPGPFPAIE